MNIRHWLGQEAEERAQKWFSERSRRCKFLEKNFRCRRGEIDLIFEEFDVEDSEWSLVFIEVRARAFRSWVSGAQSLVWKKRQKIQMTARHFLMTYTGPARSIRFDLLSWDGKEWQHFSGIDMNGFNSDFSSI